MVLGIAWFSSISCIHGAYDNGESHGLFPSFLLFLFHCVICSPFLSLYSHPCMYGICLDIIIDSTVTPLRQINIVVQPFLFRSISFSVRIFLLHSCPRFLRLFFCDTVTSTLPVFTCLTYSLIWLLRFCNVCYNIYTFCIYSVLIWTRKKSQRMNTHSFLGP